MKMLVRTLIAAMLLLGGWAAAGPAAAAPGYTDVSLSYGTGFGCPVDVTNTGTAPASNVLIITTTLAPFPPHWVGTVAPGEIVRVSYGDCGWWGAPKRIFALTTSADVNWANNSMDL